MLRALLRRIPRFGFVTLFALMLLFVSAAGWLKFHLDLWQEEETLFADLAEAGVGYAFIRHSGNSGGELLTGPVPQPPAKWWDPLVPFFSRIDHIAFRNPAPRELLERAARLPYVRSVNGGPSPLGSTPTEAAADRAGFPVETLPMPVVPTELPALPEGERLTAEAAQQALTQFADAFVVAWPTLRQGTAYVVNAVPARRMFIANAEDIRFAAMEDGIEIQTPRSRECYVLDGARYRQTLRSDHPAETANFEAGGWPGILADSRGYLKENVQACGIDSAVLADVRDPARATVERIDEQRIRIDLAPIVVDYLAVDCSDAYAVAMIVRQDLDWDIEAWDIAGSRTKEPETPPPTPLFPPGNASFRGTLKREADCVVAEEWTVDCWFIQSPTVAPGRPPLLPAYRMAGSARYDFSSKLDPARLQAQAALDPIFLPPQRELPWLPWHRATFALGLGLLACVGVRRFWNRSNMASGGRQSPEVPGVAFDSASGD